MQYALKLKKEYVCIEEGIHSKITLASDSDSTYYYLGAVLQSSYKVFSAKYYKSHFVRVFSGHFEKHKVIFVCHIVHCSMLIWEDYVFIVGTNKAVIHSLTAKAVRQPTYKK